ncbi:YlbL family protein [Amnibacterium kyonggiense]|uniref:endopeptidase La n=1 Tax=Amnibacterium kyonggiense TaxID=595671 RepID=A0A4R7FJ98_9MICO|nr:PDZ domain-containing protein [Amnibacterium kyonggiense]TDS75956.1 PDZ domain-containing protein [Amnibacterium kyonggiense]
MQEQGPRSLDAHSRPATGTSRVVPVVALLAVALVLVVALLPSPYAVEQPGPVFDTLGSSGTGKDRAPLISIPDRRTYPTTGRLDLLTVSVVGTVSSGPSWLDLAQAWLDPTKTVIPLEAVFPQGETQQQADRESAQEMTSSQQSAIAAALTDLGYDVDGKVTVATVRAGSAAAGVLRPGDVVTEYDGRRIQDACSLQNAVIAGGAKASTVVVTRDGASRTLDVTPKRVPDGTGGTRPLLGVTSSATVKPPFEVDLRIDDVGGPSAGMMFALGIIDKLTPGSLTGGRHVAGTGTICGDGTVGAIGGIVQKMAAARAAGATLFLAPEANCDEVEGHIPGGLDVVAVGTLSDSLEALEHVRDQGSVRGLPTCSARVGSSG